LEAFHNSNYESAIAYGRELVDGNSAGPGDISIVAQSYASIGDCDNARLWAQKAQDTFQAAGVVPDGSLLRVISCCGPGLKNYELAIACTNHEWMTAARSRLGIRSRAITYTDPAQAILTDFFTLFSMTSM
jgi:hypothetical protein